MKKLNYFFIFLFFMFALIFFLPHKNLLFLSESLLSKNKISISQELINKKLFGLEIINSEISYDGVKAGNINNITLNVLGIYNKLTINEAIIDTKSFNSIPKNIKLFEASYTLFSPNTIEFYSESDLGIMKGYINLINQKLILEFHPSKEATTHYGTILKFFKVQQEGLYTYEKNIKLY